MVRNMDLLLEFGSNLAFREECHHFGRFSGFIEADAGGFRDARRL